MASHYNKKKKSALKKAKNRPKCSRWLLPGYRVMGDLTDSLQSFEDCLSFLQQAWIPFTH